MEDPMEKMVRDALTHAGFRFTEDGQPGSDVNKRLDFHLTDYNVHIEVKRAHSPRISEQMSRVPDVIAVQGQEAMVVFCALLLGAGDAEDMRADIEVLRGPAPPRLKPNADGWVCDRCGREWGMGEISGCEPCRIKCSTT